MSATPAAASSRAGSTRPRSRSAYSPSQAPRTLRPSSSAAMPLVRAVTPSPIASVLEYSRLGWQRAPSRSQASSSCISTPSASSGEHGSGEAPVQPHRRQQLGSRLDARLAVAFFVAGIGFLTIANAPWAHGIGVACFFGFILSGYRIALPEDVVDGGN